MERLASSSKVFRKKEPSEKKEPLDRSKGRIKEGKFPNCPMKVVVKISRKKWLYASNVGVNNKPS
jgi:hypothetical protein